MIHKDFIRNLISTVHLFVGLVVLYPITALAQQVADLSYIENAIDSIQGLVEQLIPLVIAIALLVFIVGLVQFIASLGDEESKEVGKRRMVWGVIALFVIVSVWGIVNLLGEITGVQQGGEVDVPTVPI